ncbi:MAG: lysozyme inhibitor LprI family protein [Magnetovibrionaceae bacterium]
MRGLLAGLLFTLVAGGPAGGQAEEVDCLTAISTVELTYCSEKIFQAADRALNETYRQVLGSIDAQPDDLAERYDKATWRENLTAAQRNWNTFRDADCKGLVPMEWQGGTGTSSAVLSCMARKTDIRERDLYRRYLSDGGQETPAPRYGRLTALERGDRGCYLHLHEIGEEDPETHLGHHDLCSGQDLVGRLVRVTLGRELVQSTRCEGDPSCRESESLWLIDGIKPF